MCVIILAEDSRPSERMIEMAWHQNPDMGGMAWREPNPENPEEIQVVWKKGLDLPQLKELAATVPLPFVFHVRRTTVGGTRPELNHPFEIAVDTNEDLEGRGTNSVLFHNGTWQEWAAFAREAAVRSGTRIPVGRWSDSRAMAWLCAIYGEGFMEFLTIQRGVAFGPNHYHVFLGEGWVTVKDNNKNLFWCSNDRPWKNGMGFRQQTVEHVVCLYNKCVEQDKLDEHGYCPKHTGGFTDHLKFQVDNTSNGHKVTGGAPVNLPFDPTITLITLETAERLEKEGKINKPLLKGIRRTYARIRRGGAQADRAMKNLELVSRSLTFVGKA